jgi:hypothetical protein
MDLRTSLDADQFFLIRLPPATFFARSTRIAELERLPKYKRLKFDIPFLVRLRFGLLVSQYHHHHHRRMPTPSILAADKLVKHTLAERLRREIVTGALRPGARIVEGKWPQKFGVAQGSIREAINILT